MPKLRAARIPRPIVAGLDALELTTTVVLNPDVGDAIKEAKQEALDGPDGGSVELLLGTVRWYVEARGAGQFWRYRLTRPDGRTMMLRKQPLPRSDRPIEGDPRVGGSARPWHPWVVKFEWDADVLWDWWVTGQWPVDAAVAEAARFMPPKVKSGGEIEAHELEVTRIDLCADVADVEFAAGDFGRFYGQTIRRTAMSIDDLQELGSGPDDDADDTGDDAPVQWEAADNATDYRTWGRWTGAKFGGSHLTQTLYAKTIEQVVSRKTWMRLIWAAAAQDGEVYGIKKYETPVWRLENRIRRNAARSFGLNTAAQCTLDTLTSVWRALVGRWVTLRVDGPRSALDWRWRMFLDAWGGKTSSPRQETLPERTPERAVRACIGSLATLAAAMQADGIMPAIDRMAAELEASEDAREQFEAAVRQRVADEVLRRMVFATAGTRRHVVALLLDAVAEWAKGADDLTEADGWSLIDIDYSQPIDEVKARALGRLKVYVAKLIDRARRRRHVE